jgi:DNA-directed RNA polymerase specialized sigma24 family protein
MATQKTSAEFRPKAHLQRLQKAAYLNDPTGMSAADIAHAMDKVLGRWLDQFFMRRAPVSREEAEELTQEVWCKLLAGQHRAHTNAFALICRAANHELLDHLRRENRLRDQANGDPKAGSAEVRGDDEFWGRILDEVGDVHLSDIDAFELRDCLTKQFHRFDQQYPEKFHLFLYLAEGLSVEEIAFIEFPECTEESASKFSGTARGRIAEARKKAREFFEICRD